jgi:uncharacterized protein (UPF0335 family)
MDWKIFVVEMTKALSWPVAALCIMLFLRGSISQLLPRISKLKHKDTEIEFAEVIGALKERAESLGIEGNGIPKGLKIEETRLEKLAVVLPRSSIIQSWGLIDREVSDLIIEKKVSTEDRSLNTSDVTNVLQSIGLDKKSIKTFLQLRKLMKSVTGPSKFSLEEEQVDSYIELAIDLTHKIRIARSNNLL